MEIKSLPINHIQYDISTVHYLIIMFCGIVHRQFENQHGLELQFFEEMHKFVF